MLPSARRPAPASTATVAVVNEPFAPPGQQWTGVSPQLRTMRRMLVVLGAAAGTLVLGGAAGLAAGAWWPALAVALAAAAAAAWAWIVIGRNQRAWGYAERDEDLLVRRGILFRQLVVVPYGRMQFVDVTAGPLERRFRIARVQLHTAAATTDAFIPGLPPEQAAVLRDRLAARGEAGAAGL